MSRSELLSTAHSMLKVRFQRRIDNGEVEVCGQLTVRDRFWVLIRIVDHMVKRRVTYIGMTEMYREGGFRIGVMPFIQAPLWAWTPSNWPCDRPELMMRVRRWAMQTKTGKRVSPLGTQIESG